MRLFQLCNHTLRIVSLCLVRLCTAEVERVVNMLEGPKMFPNVFQGHKMRILYVQLSLVRQLKYFYKILVRENEERRIRLGYTLLHKDTLDSG
jgi:hypothetical protein